MGEKGSMCVCVKVSVYGVQLLVVVSVVGWCKMVFVLVL